MTGRLLIVDDVATNRIVLRSRLAESMHETIMAADGLTALQAVRDDRPDLVLLDLDLPDLPGMEVLARLRADPATCDLPVIIVTANTGAAVRTAAFAAGADDILPKPPDPALLLARIRTLLRRGNEASVTALPGLGDAATAYDWPGLITLTAFTTDATALRDRIAPALSHRLAIRDRQALLGPAAQDRPLPDAYLIDATAQEGAAMAMLSELRTAPASRSAGIAILAPDGRLAALAYDLGADEVFPADATGEEIALRLDALLRRTRSAARRREALHDHVRLALTDPLTGLHNRRYALRRLAELSVAAVGTGQAFAVLLADLDHFKQVNDAHGHIAGDAVLAEVAARLRDQTGAADLLARIGGEEFLIALPVATCAEAETRARAICDAIARGPVHLADGRAVTVTLSIGLTHARPGSLPEDLIARADRALLSAKTQGRNRVIVSRDAA